jgi:hypothetical protein
VSNEKARNLSVFAWSTVDILRDDFAEIFPDPCGAPGLRYVIFHFLRCLVLGHFFESVRDITIA